MKRSTDLILVIMISVLGICAVAFPAIKNHNNEFISVSSMPAPNNPVALKKTESDNIRVNISEYKGIVTGFRSATVIAPQDGVLENWLIGPSESVFELDRVATISVLTAENNHMKISGGNAEPRSLSPARIFDSVQKSKERLHERIHSTTTGTLRIRANAGDSILKGETIAQIIDEQYSILKFEVSQGDFDRIRDMMGVEIHSKEYPSERFLGRIISKDKNKSSVRIEILNLPDYVLHPGTCANATFRF